MTCSPPADVPTTALPQVLQSQVFLHSRKAVGEFLKTIPEVKGRLKVKVVILQQRGCEIKLSLVPLFYTTGIKRKNKLFYIMDYRGWTEPSKRLPFFLLSLKFVQKSPRNEHLMVHVLPSCRDISLICRYVYLKIFVIFHLKVVALSAWAHHMYMRGNEDGKTQPEKVKLSCNTCAIITIHFFFTQLIIMSWQICDPVYVFFRNLLMLWIWKNCQF